MASTMTKVKEKTAPAELSQVARKKAPLSRFSQELNSLFGRAPFWSLRDEMDSLINRFSDDWSSGWLTQGFDASLDMSETDDAIEVRLDVPGIKPEEIEVEVAGNQLRISGERKEETEEKSKTFHRIERHSGSFSRAVTLPCDVNENQVQASCENGVLTVSLPKCEAVKPHKISVKPKAK
ncbi:Hsp20/alpha crystallin family protein [Gimesia fumaroli]|uniref:Spore protein SP21 n=1 Tax=Gimesia fumaroli TaxID=2527976 RepID=A0A518IFS5_9PLAN|nr:Hsp20/alpha crystallin family protein [Gimesia fumaroli]QDV51947.1 Spore protein SP21 [Gimesia fumaroli]